MSLSAIRRKAHPGSRHPRPAASRSLLLLVACLAAGCTFGHGEEPPVAEATEALVGEVEEGRDVETTGRIDPTPDQRATAAASLAAAQAEVDAIVPLRASMTEAEWTRRIVEIRCRHTGCPPGLPSEAVGDEGRAP